MEGIASLDLQILRWLQSLGGLEALMRLLTFTGTVEFYLLWLPCLYWCWNAEIGLRLGMILMSSAGLNQALKVAFHQPRPYWFIPDLARVSVSGGDNNFAFPSGHAQNAVAHWGLFAASLPGRRRLPWVLAAVLVVLVGISRVYLGVHSVDDVFAGWIAGALLLAFFVRVEAPVGRWLRRQRLAKQILAALLLSLSLLLVFALAREARSGWELPQAWSENALARTGVPIEPLAWEGSVDVSGVLLGMGFGAAWLAQVGAYAADGPARKRLARLVLGMLGMLILWFGLRAALPHGESPLVLALRFLRSGLVGFWVAGLAPALFVRLGLADLRSPGPSARSGTVFGRDPPSEMAQVRRR